MLNKLKALREEREEGFTLIELLVVILIIGILASIAIPVFLNQRQTANDGAVESDVKNAANQVETWIVGLKGANKPITATDLTNFQNEMKVSTGVSMAIVGTSNNYCIIGVHDNGKNYKKDTAPEVQAAGKKTLNYDSATGGLSKACSGAASTAPADWNLFTSGAKTVVTPPVIPSP